MALSISDITCVYAPGTSMASRALEGVSLEVRPGELTVVIGPTGSGKTTLLRAAAGLLPLVSGAIELDGGPLSDAPRGAIGLVFQRPESQFFALSVEDDCAFGPRNLGFGAEGARTAAREALESVGLDPSVFGEREPWSLSGGEARRAALAGVLAMRPRYVLMDEPTAGLDAAGRDAVCSAIERARHDAGLLVVTHDPELFLGHADRVLVLGGGRPVFVGGVGAFLEALPELAGAGSVEPPEVARALLLARARGADVTGSLTLDPHVVAGLLAAASTSRGGDA